jgi:hypothetical protein
VDSYHTRKLYASICILLLKITASVQEEYELKIFSASDRLNLYVAPGFIEKIYVLPRVYVFTPFLLISGQRSFLYTTLTEWPYTRVGKCLLRGTS